MIKVLILGPYWPYESLVPWGGLLKVDYVLSFQFFWKHTKLFCLYLSNRISLRGVFIFKTNGRISSITSYKDHCCSFFTSWVIKQQKSWIFTISKIHPTLCVQYIFSFFRCFGLCGVPYISWIFHEFLIFRAELSCFSFNFTLLDALPISLSLSFYTVPLD